MNRTKANNSLQISSSFLFSTKPQQFNHQYRATQLWHTSLEAFLTGVPLSQHRAITRFWRVFENSFTGSEAVSWFHIQLREQFDKDISREQTRKLLGKFYRAGVFCNVDPSEDPLDEKDFKDSQLQIYRLTMERPAATSPKKTSPKKDYSISIVPLSIQEKDTIYWEMLVETLNDLNVSPVIPPTSNIQTNLSGLGASCTIQDWTVHAMNYLKNYPTGTEHHVNYANFEHDVFFIIFDYFFGYCERVGNFLDPSFLLTNNVNVTPVKQEATKYEEKFPFPKSEFEEIDKIFTPKSNPSKRFIMGKNRRRILHDTSLDVNVKPMELFDDGRYRGSVYFATSFGSNNSPITRVLSQTELYAYDNPNLNLSPADLINHPKYCGLKGRFLGRKSLSVGDLLNTTEMEPPETQRHTIEAMSLLLLTLEPDKRKHLEVLLKFMRQVEKNEKLTLDVAVTNKQYLLNYFGRILINNWNNPTERDLISCLISNVDNLFGGEYLTNWKKKVEDVISHKQIKKIPPTSKENDSFCMKISMNEYEDQRLLGETSKKLRALLDAICEVKDEKIKKKQLKKFRSEYPHIYNEKFNNQDSPFQQQNSKKRTPFGVLI